MATKVRTIDGLYRIWLSPAAAALVFVLAIVLYDVTLAPTVTLVDSGELILTSRTFGIAHPPGFPLYLMMAHVASLLPFGNIAERVNFTSAFFAALAVAMMTLLVTEILRSQFAEKQENNSSEDKADAEVVYVIIPAVIGGLLMAFSRTLWAYATVAEIYTLNTLLILSIFALMAAWRQEIVESRNNESPASDRKLYLAALIFGLALGVHHVTVALTLPAIGWLVYTAEGRSFFLSRRLILAALIAIAGLSVYIYLPLAASHSPLLNWGDPRSVEGFWTHITGRQYRVFFGFTTSGFVEFGRFVVREFGAWWMPAVLMLAVTGLVHAFRRNRVIFWFLVLVMVCNIIYCSCYTIGEDKDAYYLPVFVAIIIAAAIGIQPVIEAIQTTQLKAFLTPARAAFALLVVPILALVLNFPFNNRSRYFIAQDYVDNALKPIEPRGMLMTTDWQLYSPSLYLREIEGRRKDVKVIDVNLLRRSWYYGYLEQAYPDLTAASRDKIDALLVELRAWDSDPELYEKNASLNHRINQRFGELLTSLVSTQIKSASLYITIDLADDRTGAEPQFTKALKEQFNLVPQGLVFRVVEKNNPVSLTFVPIVFPRGFTDGTLKLESDDVAKRTVMPNYRGMFTNTGQFFAANGDQIRAAEQFRAALALDPDFEPAKRALSAIQNTQQNKPQK